MSETVLFGVNVIGILLALLKLLADTFKWPEEIVKWLRALVAALCVGLVGLQSMGLIFGPETGEWVLFVMSIVAAFLVTMGYAPAVIGTVTALADIVRLAAANKTAQQLLRMENEMSAAQIIATVERRYKLPLSDL